MAIATIKHTARKTKLGYKPVISVYLEKNHLFTSNYKVDFVFRKDALNFAANQAEVMKNDALAYSAK